MAAGNKIVGVTPFLPRHAELGNWLGEEKDKILKKLDQLLRSWNQMWIVLNRNLFFGICFCALDSPQLFPFFPLNFYKIIFEKARLTQLLVNKGKAICFFNTYSRIFSAEYCILA